MLQKIINKRATEMGPTLKKISLLVVIDLEILSSGICAASLIFKRLSFTFNAFQTSVS